MKGALPRSASGIRATHHRRGSAPVPGPGGSRGTLAAAARPLMAALALVAHLAGATVPGLNWSLEDGATISGDRLVVDLPVDGVSRRALATAKADISHCLGEDTGARLDFRVRGTNVQVPSDSHNGVKAMLSYRDTSGVIQYPQFSLPTGTFGWTNGSVRVNFLRGTLPADGKVTIALGLQDSGGRVEFDLSALSLVAEPLGVERVNGDYTVGYPEGPSALSRHPLRGGMSPTRATTEADVATLASWGATLLRFQICRNFSGVDDNQDLDEYAAWVDTRLDNLEDVLGWCGARGMKVCVDLHVPPGGRNAEGEANLFNDAGYLEAFVQTWRRIATRFAGHPAIYGYDLINEPRQRSPALSASYWEAQRLAAVAVRAIDPDTPIVVEANSSASPSAFSYLSPLAMDNVIYQVHMYVPAEYSHQGVDSRALLPDVRWPDSSRGWDADYLRRVLEPVRAFQTNHQCRIYVGEFGAVAWAGGAGNWFRDCIDLFEEYGWDWTYHAFREWAGWSLEHEGADIDHMAASSDNPRKRAIVESMRLAPDAGWFSANFAGGAASVTGGTWRTSPWNASGEILAFRGRDGVARFTGSVTPRCGLLPRKLADAAASTAAQGQVASLSFVEEDNGSLSAYCLVSEEGHPRMLRVGGFSHHIGVPCQTVVEIACTGGLARVRYAVGPASGPLSRLRADNGETWFDSPVACPEILGRVSLTDRVAFSSIAGSASGAPDTLPPLAFGATAEATPADGSSGAVTVTVADSAPGIPPDASLLLTLSGNGSGPGAALAAIELPFEGDGQYTFDTAGILDAQDLAGDVYYTYEISLVDSSGAAVPQAPAATGTLRVSASVPWFSADASNGRVKGGSWRRFRSQPPPAVSDGGWKVTLDSPITFQAYSPRGGRPRVEVALEPFGGFLPARLPSLLANSVARGDRAAIVSVEGDDGTRDLRGLALVDGAPAWVPLLGAPQSATTLSAEFDLEGETPLVSYLAAEPGTAIWARRLRFPSGAEWMPAAGGQQGGASLLQGVVSVSGTAGVRKLLGTVSVPAAEAEEYEARLRRTTLMLLK